MEVSFLNCSTFGNQQCLSMPASLFSLFIFIHKFYCFISKNFSFTSSNLSHGKRALTSEETNTNSVPRWRSDDDSDDEEQQSLNRVAGASPYTRSTRGVRRSRLMR